MGNPLKTQESGTFLLGHCVYYPNPANFAGKRIKMNIPGNRLPKRPPIEGEIMDTFERVVPRPDGVMTGPVIATKVRKALGASLTNAQIDEALDALEKKGELAIKGNGYTWPDSADETPKSN